jgi:myosin heavy subunit
MSADHCGLIYMNEPCVLENSRLRFMADAIYTLVGTIMIAVNPFARIEIYGCGRTACYHAAPLTARVELRVHIQSSHRQPRARAVPR